MTPSPSMIAREDEPMTDKYFYLAGPMSGYPGFNFGAFDEAANDLRASGYNIVSPAELDTDEDRQRALDSPDGDQSNLTHAKPWAECLARDSQVVFDANCEGVIVIDGWEKSKGARFETYIAQALDKPIFEYRTHSFVGPCLIPIDRDIELAVADELSPHPIAELAYEAGLIRID